MIQRVQGGNCSFSGGTRSWSARFDIARRIRTLLASKKDIPPFEINRTIAFCRTGIFHVDYEKRKEVARFTISLAEIFAMGPLKGHAASLADPVNAAVQGYVPLKDILRAADRATPDSNLALIAAELQVLGLIGGNISFTPQAHRNTKGEITGSSNLVYDSGGKVVDLFTSPIAHVLADSIESRGLLNSLGHYCIDPDSSLYQIIADGMQSYELFRVHFLPMRFGIQMREKSELTETAGRKLNSLVSLMGRVSGKIPEDSNLSVQVLSILEEGARREIPGVAEAYAGLKFPETNPRLFWIVKSLCKKYKGASGEDKKKVFRSITSFMKTLKARGVPAPPDVIASLREAGIPVIL